MVIFFISCKNVPEMEKSEEEKLIGKWRLINSITISDSIYLSSSWIEFKKGNYFKSNTSFFWTKDSSKSQPLSGSYSIYIESDPLMLSRHECCHTYIILTIDTISHSWVFGRDSLNMYWSNDPYSLRQYSWTLTN